MQVALRGLERAVVQRLADDLDRRPGAQERGGVRVAQLVGMEAHRQLGRRAHAGQAVLDRAHAEAPGVSSWKHRGAFAGGPDGQPSSERQTGPGVQDDVGATAALAGRVAQQAVRQVDLLKIEVDDLGDAEARVEEDQEDAEVARLGRGLGRLGQGRGHIGYLDRGERRAGLERHGGTTDGGCRVRGQLACSHEEVEEAPQDGEAAVPGVRRQQRA